MSNSVRPSLATKNQCLGMLNPVAVHSSCFKSSLLSRGQECGQIALVGSHHHLQIFQAISVNRQNPENHLTMMRLKLVAGSQQLQALGVDHLIACAVHGQIVEPRSDSFLGFLVDWCTQVGHIGFHQQSLSIFSCSSALH